MSTASNRGSVPVVVVLHTCRHCGYAHPTPIVERAWELLVRCPICDSYDWTPEPWMEAKSD